MQDFDYVVLDVETTGLNPARGDRIVEIAIVRLNSLMEPLAQFTSIVKPGRPVGASWIHGITEDHVREAPGFYRIAGDALTLLNGAVLVAHNAAFDERFLRAELQLCGHSVEPLPYLCTYALSREFVHDTRDRKLPTLCEHFGIATGKAHSAMSDALATSELLRRLMPRVSDKPRHVSPLKFARNSVPRPSKIFLTREMFEARRSSAGHDGSPYPAEPFSAGSAPLSNHDVTKILGGRGREIAPNAKLIWFCQSKVFQERFALVTCPHCDLSSLLRDGFSSYLRYCKKCKECFGVPKRARPPISSTGRRKAPNLRTFAKALQEEHIGAWVKREINRGVARGAILSVVRTAKSSSKKDWWKRRELESAVLVLEGAFKSRSDEAKRLEKEGKTETAVRFYQQLIRDGDPGPHSHDRLRLYFTKAGDYKKAIGVCMDFLQNSTNAKGLERFAEHIEKLTDMTRR